MNFVVGETFGLWIDKNGAVVRSKRGVRTRSYLGAGSHSMTRQEKGAEK